MSGGLIPQRKADKVECGGGVILTGTFACANQKELDKWIADFQRLIVQRQDAAAKGQQEMKFDSGLTIGGVHIRAEKPKMKDRTYEVCIEMKDLKKEDRDTLFAMSQDDSKEIHIQIVQKAKPSLKLDEPKADADSPDPTADPSAPVETKIEKRMLDHSNDDFTIPIFQADSLEERLQAALLLREGAAQRWADRINAGMKDEDLRKAISSEWNDEQYQASTEGKHFIVKSGNKPSFWLADSPGVRANMTSKPTLQGAALLAKAREVLGITDSSQTGKSKAKK